LDWWWFGAVGYREVFLRGLKAKATLGSVVLGIGFLVLYGNLWIAMSSIVAPYIVIGTGAGTVQPAMVRREQVRKLTGIGAAVVALMISLAASSEWFSWLQFWNGVPFGNADPILGHDAGFYIYQLPVFDFAKQV